MIHPLTRMERKLFLKESGVADSEVNVDHIKLSRHDAKSRWKIKNKCFNTPKIKIAIRNTIVVMAENLAFNF